MFLIRKISLILKNNKLISWKDISVNVTLKRWVMISRIDLYARIFLSVHKRSLACRRHVCLFTISTSRHYFSIVSYDRKEIWWVFYVASWILLATCILKFTKVTKSLLGKLFPPDIKIYRDIHNVPHSCFSKLRTCFSVFVKGQFSSRSKITVQYFAKMDHVKLEIVFTTAAPAFDILFIGCVLNTNNTCVLVSLWNHG